MEIVGRLTADATVNTLKDERKVVNFSVAVNDSYKPKGSDSNTKVTTYFNCSYWMSPAIAEHLTKGVLVECYGRISANAWTNAEGEAKASLNFHVNNIKLHGKSNATTKEPIQVAAEIKEPLEDLPF
ncbi:MAG: single-stranded DNA-binding protein [Ferruginibacter sp.]